MTTKKLQIIVAKNPYMDTPFPNFKDRDKLSKKEATREVEKLREAIEHHDYLYYINNKPAISDNKYDKLFQRLVDLEEEYPELRSDTSPTRKVGAEPLDKLKKRRHSAPMLSLSSSTEKQKIRDFIRKMKDKAAHKAQFVLEPKFDGLSVEVVYKDGRFSHGATRGDGDTGEDISENLKTISSLPLKLRSKKEVPGNISVRGELFMSREGFQKLNKKKVEKGEEPFANARNAAAGLIRQLASKNVAGKPLDIFFYEVLDSDADLPDSHWEILENFPEWGLKTNDEIKKTGNFKDIEQYYGSIADTRDDLPYEIDGIVIKLNDRQAREDLGTSQRSPKWAYAWKFEPKKEVTTLREITVQVGRTGILTPVALLDPVEVGGVTVSRATLHNEDEVEKKDVRPGDKVRVIRAGDVIPEVVERIKQRGKKRSDPFHMPRKCPACHTKVEREGAYVICPNGLSCPAQLKGSLTHFASREAMNIQSLGEKVVEQLVEKDMVKSVPDLYQLDKEDLKELEGFAEKSASKLYKSIQDSLSGKLPRFIYALGIRHVGQHMADILAREFGSLEKISNASKEDLEKVPEVGPETAQSIVHFFDNDNTRKMLGEFDDLGLKLSKPKMAGSGKLKDKTFVLTGELEKYTRDEAKEKIEALGGKATSSVSSNTDYLVVGEGPGQKLDEAKENEVKILHEKEFLKLFGE